MTKKLLTAFALATTLLVASPIAKPYAPEPQPAPAPVSRSLDATALRVAGRIIYNAHTINLDKGLNVDVFREVATPEPNTNLLIGAGLLGVAYLLRNKGVKTPKKPVLHQ